MLNQPYGGFPWIDLPMAANQNWYNSHNFYGELAHLDAATLEDVRSFFKTFYSPNNAVLVITHLEPAHLRTCAPAHLRTCAPAHLRTRARCAPAHLRTRAPAHLRTCLPAVALAAAE